MEIVSILSRLQFGLTAGYHIMFPTLLIGLSCFLSFLYWRWLRTNQEYYLDIYQLWLRVLIIIYVLGAITGVALSTQLDNVFSHFYDRVESTLLPFRHFELVFAILLEGGSIGVMLLCTRSKRSYSRFAATLLFNFGILLTAFFVVSRNSWMNTPAGFVWLDDKAIATSYLDIVFNPSFPLRYLHMITAGLLATSFFVLGISAWQLLINKRNSIALKSMHLGLKAALLLSLSQFVIGDMHGLNVYEHQPMKIAAIEGQWETEQGAAFKLFAIPDDVHEYNRHEIKIPYVLSLVLGHDPDSTIHGLKEIPPANRPNVAVSFFAFRVMILMGILMLVTAISGFILKRKRPLESRPWFLRWCVAMLPAGLIAVIAGWTAAEEARQPWTIYGVLKTMQTVTADSSGQIVFSLMAFGLGYAALTFAGLYFLNRVLTGKDLAFRHS